MHTPRVPQNKGKYDSKTEGTMQLDTDANNASEDQFF
jgi:hypothetical protein